MKAKETSRRKALGLAVRLPWALAAFICLMTAFQICDLAAAIGRDSSVEVEPIQETGEIELGESEQFQEENPQTLTVFDLELDSSSYYNSANRDGSASDADSELDLANYRVVDYDQSKIDLVGVQSMRSQACLGYSYAYVETITTGKIHSWSEYDSRGGVYESSFYGRKMPERFNYATYSTRQATLRAAYDAVSANMPSIVWVTRTNGNQHWVTIIGYRSDADPDDLSLSDFLMLDPLPTSITGPERLDCRGYVLRLGYENLRTPRMAPVPTVFGQSEP